MSFGAFICPFFLCFFLTQYFIWAAPFPSDGSAQFGKGFKTTCLDQECRRLRLRQLHSQENPSLHRRQLSLDDKNLTEEISISSSKGMIHYQVHCTPSQRVSLLNPQFCRLIAHAFKLSGDYLENLIRFQVPITVDATVHDLCTSPSTTNNGERLTEAACSSMLGYGRPSGMWQLHMENMPLHSDRVVFPQALVRQKTAGQPMPKDASLVDVDMEFNSGFQDRFYFSRAVFEASGLAQEQQYRIGPQQYDFLYIALHEQMHGLGVVTLFDKYMDELPDALRQKYQASVPLGWNLNSLLTPPITWDPSESGVIDVGPITAYDYFLATATSNAVYRWAEITQNTLTPFLVEGIKKESGSEALRLLAESANTSDGIVFAFEADDATLFGDTSSVVLQSGQPYVRGTSIVHFDRSAYAFSEDFLMRPELENGTSLEEWMDRLGGDLKPFGRNTARILESMGYQLENPAQSALNMRRGELTSSVSSPFHMELTYFLPVLITLMLI